MLSRPQSCSSSFLREETSRDLCGLALELASGWESTGAPVEETEHGAEVPNRGAGKTQAYFNSMSSAASHVSYATQEYAQHYTPRNIAENSPKNHHYGGYSAYDMLWRVGIVVMLFSPRKWMNFEGSCDHCKIL